MPGLTHQTTPPPHQGQIDNAEPKKKIKANLPRNFCALAADTCLQRWGWVFKLESLIIPMFVMELGATAAFLGIIATTSRTMGQLPQFFFAHLIEPLKRKKPIALIFTILFVCCWTAAGLLFILSPPIQKTGAWPSSLFWIFLFIYADVARFSRFTGSIPDRTSQCLYSHLSLNRNNAAISLHHDQLYAGNCPQRPAGYLCRNGQCINGAHHSPSDHHRHPDLVNELPGCILRHCSFITRCNPSGLAPGRTAPQTQRSRTHPRTRPAAAALVFTKRYDISSENIARNLEL